MVFEGYGQDTSNNKEMEYSPYIVWVTLLRHLYSWDGNFRGNVTHPWRDKIGKRIIYGYNGTLNATHRKIYLLFVITCLEK